jgi:hypothetical protein
MELDQDRELVCHELRVEREDIIRYCVRQLHTNILGYLV